MLYRIKRWFKSWQRIEIDNYPRRFVQLLTFQDKIIGLSGDGDIYTIDTYPYHEPTIQLWMKNPLWR